MLSANSANAGSSAASGEMSLLPAGGCGDRRDVRDEGRIGVVGREGGFEAREGRAFVDMVD
jgi:hypothetical protein